MEQEKLENKVKELMEQQGFQFRKIDNGYSVRENNEELFRAHIFSSEEYKESEIREKTFSKNSKLFVDEKLAPIKDKIKLEVSIVKEYDFEDYDLPSFELIGEIAVINQLEDISKDEAVEAILQHHDVETILLKTDKLSGEYRVGTYEKLYGEKTETIHKEHGIKLKVDPSKVYFSERFGSERERLTSQIDSQDNVLVVGAGVGSFPIVISDKKGSKVSAIEINPKAFEYLEQNILLNNLGEKITPIEGDYFRTEFEQKFDAIIIPIPGIAHEMLEKAWSDVKSGGRVYLYRFLENEDWNKLIREVETCLASKKDFEIIDRSVCGEISPNKSRVRLDIQKKNN